MIMGMIMRIFADMLSNNCDIKERLSDAHVYNYVKGFGT